MATSSKPANQPTAEQRKLLQAVFDRFHANGEWPLVDTLQYELEVGDVDLDVVRVGEHLDPALGLVHVGYQGRASLTIHGVALCSGADGDLEDATRTMRYAYARYRAAGPNAQLTNDDLVRDLGMDPLRTRRTYELIHWLPGIGGGGGDGAGSWYRQITADIRRFKNVRTREDLLAAAPRPERLRPPAQVPVGWTWPAVPCEQGDRLRQLGEHVSREVQRITDNVERDPADAITSARALVESVCKDVLVELGQPVPQHDDLRTLYKKTALALRVDPTQYEAVYRQTLQGLVSTVGGLGILRDQMGDAHGRDRTAPSPQVRHARLAAGAAMTVSVFLVEALEALDRSDASLA
ncbi:MAG: abortive infection family protein [Candidatus Limnocylindrales bacterium]